MITNITKDITTVERGVVAHGCNCVGVMGSGVALAIRNKWPIAYERYKTFVQASKAAGQELLGLAQIVAVREQSELIDEPCDLYVANMLTQERYGYDGQRYADLSAIHSGLLTVCEFAHGLNLPVYLPLIGSDRGGLDWETEVEPVVRGVASIWPVDIYVCRLP